MMFEWCSPNINLVLRPCFTQRKNCYAKCSLSTRLTKTIEPKPSTMIIYSRNRNIDGNLIWQLWFSKKRKYGWILIKGSSSIKRMLSSPQVCSCAIFGTISMAHFVPIVAHMALCHYWFIFICHFWHICVLIIL